MKKIIALSLILILCFSLCACGGKNTDAPATETTTAAQAQADAVAPETTTVAENKAVAFGFNEKITLDFVEMTFNEYYIKEDVRESITTNDSIKVTRTFGPQPEDGMQFICFKGVIKNIAKSELPVYDFFLGEFDIDGYVFEATANDCKVYNANGETESTIPPLTEYSFILYAAIPNELANNNTAINFRFGFYDMFDNTELSRNKAFEENPISLCPYQYAITIK